MLKTKKKGINVPCIEDTARTSLPTGCRQALVFRNFSIVTAEQQSEVLM